MIERLVVYILDILWAGVLTYVIMGTEFSNEAKIVFAIIYVGTTITSIMNMQFQKLRAGL